MTEPPDRLGRLTRGRRFIGVVGPGAAAGPVLVLAEEVGKEVARAGSTLVCGGLGGIMEAACRGASSEGGLTVGFLPGDRREDANDWVEVPVPTGLGELRNALVVRASDALIALGGGYGTLSEVALAMRRGTPVIGVGTWRLVRPDGSEDEGIAVEEEPARAVLRALQLSASSSPRL